MDDFLVGPQCDEFEDTRCTELEEQYSDYDDDLFEEHYAHALCPKCDYPHHFFEECVHN